MAIVRKRNRVGPSSSDLAIKRAVESAPKDAFVHAPSDTAEHLKEVLGIQGDAVGTLNTQDVHNKTLNGGFF